MIKTKGGPIFVSRDVTTPSHNHISAFGVELLIEKNLLLLSYPINFFG